MTTTINTTTGAAINLYRALLTAAEQAPEEREEWNSCLTFRHNRTMIKLAHTAKRLRQFATDMLKAWHLWGGGEKPASEKKRARSQWPAAKIRAYKYALEDGDMEGALSLAQEMDGKAFAHASRHMQAIMYVAPEPFEFEGGADLVSALREDGYYVVMHWPSGLSAMGYNPCKSRSRGAAEEKARDFLATMQPGTIADAINAAPHSADVMALWCAQNGIAQYAIASTEQEPEALPEVAPVAQAVEPASEAPDVLDMTVADAQAMPGGDAPDSEAQTPPVVQKAEELTPRVAASPEFSGLMAQARAARQLAREAIDKARITSKGTSPAPSVQPTPQADDGNPYPYLIPTEGQRGGVAAAQNIRRVLKNEFPGIKFRVTSDYSSVNVKWTDGPTSAQVDQALAPFDIGHSDSQSDYFYTTSTRFSDTFGGVQYLFTNRAMSDAAIGASLSAVFGPNGPSVEDYHNARAWHQVQQGTFTGAQMWGDYEWMAMVRRHADGRE